MRLGRRGGSCGRAMAILMALAVPCDSLRAQAATGDDPAVCQIGVNVEDLYELDVARDTFGALLWIWSLCPSAEPAPLETISLPTAMPGLDLGEARSIPVGDAGHYQYRRILGTFRHDWDVSRYPFDRQRIAIPVDESEHSAAVVIFEPDVESSFLSPDVRSRLAEWRVSDLELATSISDEGSTYGLPHAHGARYARLEASFTLERTGGLLAFLKLTCGAFAASLMASLSWFLGPPAQSSFDGKLALLVGALFAVLINQQVADATMGDASRLTLITELHLVALALIAAIALLALRERRRAERGLPVRYPNWPALGATAGLYVLVSATLVARAAWG